MFPKAAANSSTNFCTGFSATHQPLLDPFKSLSSCAPAHTRAQEGKINGRAEIFRKKNVGEWAGVVPQFYCCLFLWSDCFGLPACLALHPSSPCNHYLLLAHMSIASLQGKLTLGANNIKPHTIKGPKLYSYTSHNMIEEGKRTHILALDAYKFNATSGCKKTPFLFLCHLSVALWTAAHISSFIGHTPKKQVRVHNVDLQLQHLPPPFSSRTRCHIQGQILPASLWAPRESRKKRQ